MKSRCSIFYEHIISYKYKYINNSSCKNTIKMTRRKDGEVLRNIDIH